MADDEIEETSATETGQATDPEQAEERKRALEREKIAMETAFREKKSGKQKSPADKAGDSSRDSRKAGPAENGNADSGADGGVDLRDESSSIPLDLIHSIPVTLKVVLGTVDIPVSALMKMQRGEIISLDRKVGEVVDVLANDQLIGRGEIIVLDEEEPVFGITLTELVGARNAGFGG